MSPASPEKASSVCLFSALVLSSEALRMVAPRIAALEAAMMVKSFPVMPRRISLSDRSVLINAPRRTCGVPLTFCVAGCRNEVEGSLVEG